MIKFLRQRTFMASLGLALSLAVALSVALMFHWLLEPSPTPLVKWIFQNRLSLSKCDLRRARLYDGPYNISTALASFPRSGNTWLRTMIEKATGFRTSSLYCDRSLRETFRSECDKRARFLVKTHFPVTSIRHFPDAQAHFRKFDRAIHVIRNPFDAIVSYHHFHKTTGHTTKLTWKKFQIHAEKLDWYIRKYRSHYLYWTNAPLRRLLVRYEDLRADPENELRRVAHFLLDDPMLVTALAYNESVSAWQKQAFDEEMLQCAVQDERKAYPTQAIHRNHLFGIDWLGEEHVATITRELLPILCQMGYHELFPRWLREKRMEESPSPRSPSFGERYLVEMDCASLETTVDFSTNFTINIRQVPDAEA